MTRRKRVATIEARTQANRGRKVAKRNMLLQGREVEKSAEQPGGSVHDKEVAMLRRNSRKGYKGLMLLSGKGVKVKRGIYRFHGSKKINPRAKKRKFKGDRASKQASFRRIVMMQDLRPPRAPR